MSVNKPLISIGVPVFNGETYLAAALDALLAQDFKDFEIILSDNGSTDATEEICSQYAGLDGRIRYYRHAENRGAAWNYNFTFQQARGTYFRWAAHDDECTSDHLARCLEAMRAQSKATVLVYPRTAWLDEEGQVIARFNDNLELMWGNPARRVFHLLRVLARCNPVFGLMRTQALAKTGLIGAYIGSDRVLLLQLALHGRFAEVPDYLFLRRMHAQISTAAHTDQRELSEWFKPGRGKQLFALPKTRIAIEYLRAVRRSALPLLVKLQCLIALPSAWVARNLLRTKSAPGQEIAYTNLPLIRDKIKKAAEYLDSGDVSAAKKECREVLSLYPRHAETLHLLAVAAYSENDYLAGIKLVRQALARDAKIAAYHNTHGMLSKAAGDVTGAEAAYRAALKCDSSHAVAWNNLGRVLMEAGDLFAAQRFYQQALDINDAYVEAHYNMSCLHLQGGDQVKAVAGFNRVLQLAPDFQPAVDQLARLT